MLTCVAILGSRLALKRERLIRKTPLTWAIIVFLFLGGIRLYCDIFLHLSPATQVVTIRDSAVVYYALFFFIAYKVGLDPVGRRLLERCVLVACIVLLPIFIIQFFAAPDFFNRITVRGYPLIVQKGDLAGTYLAFASFYFFLRPATGARLLAFRFLSVLFFVGMLILMSRAAIFGCICAALLLLLARRPQFVFYQATIGFFALILVALLQFGQTKGEANMLTRLADRVESMTDISGSHSYRGGVGDYSAGNNQFRTVWWTSVFDETIRKGPLFGLGFGYDLAAGFIKDYYGNLALSFDTRSPHSVWVTVFGRMGLLGLLSFTFVVFCILREAIAAARRVRRGQAPASSLGFWTGVIIILGSASFGVVLEGPMGGVLFWTFLGLACSQSTPEKEKDASENEVRLQPRSAPPPPTLVAHRRPL